MISAVVLDAARAGDADAFRALVDAHHTELYVHCHRMLGSAHDAEDALQDAMLRAWRGLAGLEDGSRLRPWLYKIARNASLDTMKRQGRVVPVDDYGTVDSKEGAHGSGTTPEDRYEQREAVARALIAALRHLPGRQPAVLILREVLGYTAREVAALLDTTVAAVNSALQRARKTVDDRLPEPATQSTPASVGDSRLLDVVERLMDAFERGDVDGIPALLAEPRATNSHQT